MASRGVNRVTIIGNLGQDPKVRYTSTGKPVVNITVATSEVWKDKSTGQEVSETEWHKCVAFGNLAEIAGEHLKKGSQVFLEGKIKTRKWQDQSGQDRYTTEIVFDEMQMLGKPNAQNQGQGQGQGWNQNQNQNQGQGQGQGWNQNQNQNQAQNNSRSNGYQQQQNAGNHQNQQQQPQGGWGNNQQQQQQGGWSNNQQQQGGWSEEQPFR